MYNRLIFNISLLSATCATTCAALALTNTSYITHQIYTLTNTQSNMPSLPYVTSIHKTQDSADPSTEGSEWYWHLMSNTLVWINFILYEPFAEIGHKIFEGVSWVFRKLSGTPDAAPAAPAAPAPAP